VGAVPGSIHAQTSLLSSPFDRYRGWKRVSREELGVSGENLDTDGAPAIGVHRVSAVERLVGDGAIQAGRSHPIQQLARGGQCELPEGDPRSDADDCPAVAKRPGRRGSGQ